MGASAVKQVKAQTEFPTRRVTLPQRDIDFFKVKVGKTSANETSWIKASKVLEAITKK